MSLLKWFYEHNLQPTSDSFKVLAPLSPAAAHSGRRLGGGNQMDGYWWILVIVIAIPSVVFLALHACVLTALCGRNRWISNANVKVALGYILGVASILPPIIWSAKSCGRCGCDDDCGNPRSFAMDYVLWLTLFPLGLVEIMLSTRVALGGTATPQVSGSAAPATAPPWTSKLVTNVYKLRPTSKRDTALLVGGCLALVLIIVGATHLSSGTEYDIDKHFRWAECQITSETHHAETAEFYDDEHDEETWACNDVYTWKFKVINEHKYGPGVTNPEYPGEYVSRMETVERSRCPAPVCACETTSASPHPGHFSESVCGSGGRHDCESVGCWLPVFDPREGDYDFPEAYNCFKAGPANPSSSDPGECVKLFDPWQEVSAWSDGEGFGGSVPAIMALVVGVLLGMLVTKGCVAEAKERRAAAAAAKIVVVEGVEVRGGAAVELPVAQVVRTIVQL